MGSLLSLRSVTHLPLSLQLTTWQLAQRTIGATFTEFVTNLYMPEELLRNRNKHEKKIYEHEPKRASGSGKVEEFRSFLLKLFTQDAEEAERFHEAVSTNSSSAVRTYLNKCSNREVKEWLSYYLKK